MMRFDTMLNTIKRKWKMTTIISLVIIAAGFSAWYFLSSKENATAEAVTIPARTGAIEVKVSGTGSVQPASTRNIMSNASGTIININFTNGQQVTKGDLLFELKNETIENEIKKAKLDLQQAQLDYNTKVQDSKPLYVYAPINGQVSKIQVESGQDVQKNSVLLEITDTSRLIFKVPVNGGQINQIQTGQNVDVSIPDLMSTVQGRVQKVDRGGTPGGDGSKMYYITVELSNPGALAPGLKAQAVIVTPGGPEPGYEGGILEWAETVSVRTGISGNLKNLYIEENAPVTKGQTLAYIANDDTGNQLLSQELRLEQARLSLDSSQKKLADCKIYASADGLVNLGSVQAGQGGSSGNSGSNSTVTESSGEDYWQLDDQVSSNQVLATIVGTSGMRVTLPVDEVDIAKIKIGQTASIVADALPDRTFNGTVIEIADQGTVQNGVASFNVTVGIDQPEGLKENMTANAEILIAKKDGVLLLPVEAVQERQGRKFVILSADGLNGQLNNSTGDAGDDSRSSGDRAGGMSNQQGRMVLVETGLYNDTMIEITSGLKEGDAVTLPGVTRTSSGNAAGSGLGNRPTDGGVMFGGGGSSRTGGFSGVPGGGGR